MIIDLKPDNNKTILQLLQEQGIKIPADCGGTMRCGKCRVKVVSGDIPVTKEDMKFFSASKYLAGYRLACHAIPTGPITIEVEDPEEAKILTGFEDWDSELSAAEEGITIFKAVDPMSGEPLYASVDIGTTTIVTTVYDETGERVGIATSMNPQRVFGADVVTRIQTARSGRGPELRLLVINAIKAGLCGILERLQVMSERLLRIVIAGNTSMLHILRGFDCEGLATFPFTPVSVDYASEPAIVCFGNTFENANVVFFPGVSAFVGADVVSGVYGEQLDKGTRPKLFMDMGTNGEMVLKTENGLLCASASAGPAFEGGELSCGMAGMTGAVESVRIVIDEDKTPGVICRVIGGGKVKGLCGSGALELLSELIKHGFVDEEGTLSEEYFDDGFPFAETEDGTVLAMTQLDIRSLQLAKSAIRASAEMLLQIGEVEEPDIILAGGMGTFIDPEMMKGIGIFPACNSITFAGNAVLKGLERYINAVVEGKEDEAAKELKGIAAGTREVTVANEPQFQKLFLKYMDFGSGQ